ncbi:MAG: NFACT RNA binding domain-containing protein [Candidatus Nanoarchaeia archaeon]
MQIKISYKKSLEENASDYFNLAKKAKKKLEGAKETLAKWERKREDLLIKAEERKLEVQEKEVKVKRAKRWYHKFRWFKTSDEFLVVGGRDATTNEAIIKKHCEPHDLVFHTDMAGSPFFVLKTEGKEPNKATLQEVGDATCTFSRAFKLNLGSQSVFYVKPEQVTKQALPGEYLQKGSFMIYGKTNYIENHINLAVGITKDNEIMAGPEESISKHCEKFIILVQGNIKASDTAKKIQKTLGGDLDEIIRALPAGNFEIQA